MAQHFVFMSEDKEEWSGGIGVIVSMSKSK